MRHPRHLLAGLLAVAACTAGPTSRIAESDAGDAVPCTECHQEIVESFVRTAHFKTSARAGPLTILGDFSDGKNVLRTHSPDVYFEMSERDGGYYQTGFTRTQPSGVRLPLSRPPRSRTEPIHIVIGSGRVGQSYLYWREDRLFQLPVSYLTKQDAWINSPGYVDGIIDFDRPILPRCLECHSTSFEPARDRSGMLFTQDYVLGITCTKCHGDGAGHIAAARDGGPADSLLAAIVNPSRFSRQGQLDACALCHGGDRRPRQPVFTFRPGEPLDEYYAPPAARDNPLPDVHGNQVGLLMSSRCFRESSVMTCSTCHDVHQSQRDLIQRAGACQECHQSDRHPERETIGDRLVASCVDCHMPRRKSDLLQLELPDQESFITYRSHAIGIYPAIADSILAAVVR